MSHRILIALIAVVALACPCAGQPGPLVGPPDFQPGRPVSPPTGAASTTQPQGTAPGASAGQSAPASIGVADLTAIFAQLGFQAQYDQRIQAATADARARAQQAVAPLQQTLAAAESELRALLEALPAEERSNEKLSANPRWTEASRQVLELRQRIQSEVQRHERALLQFDGQLKAAITTRIQPAVAAVCRERGVGVLLPKAGCIYSEGAADLTEAIIARARADGLNRPIGPPSLAGPEAAPPPSPPPADPLKDLPLLK